MGEKNTKTKFHYAYLIVASCIMITFIPFALVLSCAGIFFTPVSSYFDVPRASFALYFSIQSIAMAITSPIAGKIVKKVNIRIVLAICIALVGCSFIAMSRFTAIWQFYIAGVTLGIGAAPLVFVAVPYLINAWFKIRGGFFVGLCMAFSGIGGIIFNPIGTTMIQASAEGWRTGYLVFGIITLAIALPFVALIVRANPKEKGLEPFGANESANSSTDSSDNDHSSQSSAAVKSISAERAMKSASFYAMAGFALFVTLSMQIYQFLPSYCTSFNATAPQIAALSGLIASASMAGQAIGKVILGILNDKSDVGGLILGIASGIVGVACMCFLPMQAIILLAGSFMFGIEYALNSVEVPLLTRNVFGPADYPNIYSRIAAVGMVGGVIGPTLFGVIVDMPNGFTLMFIVSAICMSLAFVCGSVALKQGKKLR